MNDTIRDLLNEVVDLHASYDRLVKSILQVLEGDEE